MDPQPADNNGSCMHDDYTLGESSTMLELASDALKAAGKAVQAVIFDRIKTYVDYVKHCDDNLFKLLQILEELQTEKDDINNKVLGGKELQKLTGKANRWLLRIRDLTKDQMMKKLMNKDMEVAKVMLRLMKDDLKKLVEEDDEIRDVVVKVMKDVSKRKRIDGNREVLGAEDKDKEVGLVLEKLMEETMEEFKALMQNDPDMAVAALHILENHMENLERLTEKDNVVSDIMAKAKKMSVEQEWLSDDNHDSALVLENTLREKVTNLLKPVAELILSEELLKALPENVRLGMEVMNVVIGNSKGLKAELTDADNTASHVNCCCCVISYNCFSDRHDMSMAAEAMHGKIQKIIQNKPGNEDVTRPTRRDEMEAIQTDLASLKSRNELFEKIIKALASNGVNAIGVFGMGGSGKTTLATEVVNSKAKGIFKTTVMVEISESPNIESIQNQIGDGLDLKLHDVHGIREKAIRLHNKLTPKDELEGRKDEKKILVVLDNIWKKIDLDQIGIPRKYCKLLLTSRAKDVCKKMDVGDVHIFEVGLLNKDEAKDLFKFRVQKEVNIGEYKSLADRLLEKCGGLPLSIVATSNSLKGKGVPFWRQFAEDLEKPISCQISGVHHETFSILRTSYEVIASKEKKKFFLLACLSPVGTSISIDNLMRYGIGLDLFQHVNKLSEAINLARTWAEELVSSSMLLKGDSDAYVKIHDVVRESTMSFASKTDLNTDGLMFLVDAIPRWICEETFNKYIGISLLSEASYQKKKKLKKLLSEANFSRLSGVKANLLQILLLKGNRNYSSFLGSNFFQGMTNLKVLEVLFMNFEKELPGSLCKLKVLQTLHLLECKLGDIKLIGELDSLLVLSLRGSSLKELPDEIGKLSNLRLLDMSNCHCEQPGFPANVIARLSLLEGIYLVGCSWTKWAVPESTSNDTRVSNWANMDEFNKLDFLNVLEIRMLRPISFPIHTQFVKNLDKFNIHVGEEQGRRSRVPFRLRFHTADEMEEDNRLKGFLKKADTQRVLTCYHFDVTKELEKNNSLRALLKKADFLSLTRATINNIFLTKEETINNIVPELDEEGFRELTHLQLADIRDIRRICEGKAPTELFFNLRHLEVSKLHELEELFPVNPLPHNLTTLKMSTCNSLNYLFSESGDSLLSNKDDGVKKESDIIELPCLKKLIIVDVFNLTSVVKQSSIDDSRRDQGFFNSKVKLPALEKFILLQSLCIVKLWSKESNVQSFQNLKLLRITLCPELQVIGPPSLFLSLVQLQNLEIRNCDKIQQVISQESERQEIPQEVITFPKLNCLRIQSSENFDCFYGGSYKLKFPCLKTLELSYLGCMAKFTESGNSTTFFHEKIEFPLLEELVLEQLGDKVPVSCDLHELGANGEGEGEGEGITPNPVGKLETLFLGRVVAPRLRELVVILCEELQWLFSGEPNQVVELPSLENLKISGCAAMKAFSIIPVKAAKLRDINLCNCPKLEWFSSGNANCGADLELPSLEHVTIEDCPNMKLFSPATLRAPKLKLVILEKEHYSMPKSEDLNKLLQYADRS